jgi:hypothetical protein
MRPVRILTPAIAWLVMAIVSTGSLSYAQLTVFNSAVPCAGTHLKLEDRNSFNIWLGEKVASGGI